MAQIKQLKDTTGNFYPLTHIDAVVGIEDIQVDMTGYATELWVEELNYLKEHQDISNKVDVADFEEAALVTAAALNDLHQNLLWNSEQVYVKCDKTKTQEEALVGDSSVVYFTDDTKEIIVNGQSYGKLGGESSIGSEYLPLTGGTMTGAINFESSTLVKYEDTNVLLYDSANSHLCVGDNSNITETITLSANNIIIPSVITTSVTLANTSKPILNVSGVASGNILGVQVDSESNVYTTTQNLRVFGEATATAFYETSDARKKDIKYKLPLDKCYDLIDKCQTVIYSLKDQTKEQVGMIAQEIEEFFPEVVATDEEGFKSLAYDRLVVICFKVLKDVIKRLENIENHGLF